MILIIDDSSKKRKTELRNSLFDAGIPCAVVTSERLKKLEPARVTVAFAENETQLSIVSIRAGSTDYIVINDTGRRMYNTDAYFYDPTVDGDFRDFIKRRAVEKHGISIDSLAEYPVRMCDGEVYFFNRQVNLTRREEMIVRHLMFAKGEWHSSEEVARFAFDGISGGIDDSSVSVHICNINKKSVQVTGRKIILSKRFCGYKINRLEPEKKKRGPYKRKVTPPRYV